MNEKKRKVKYKGELDLAGFKLPCYVLEDGTRVLSGRGMQEALKMVDKAEEGKETPGNRLDRYLNQPSLKSFLYKGKKADHYDPIICHDGGTKIHGNEASRLIDICDAFLEARKETREKRIKKENHLPPRQEIIAKQCEIIIRSFAKVGIIALVDEATGYQYEREKAELQAILKVYVSKEILKWQETFQPSFYKEIFRLWNWPFTAESIKKKPWLVGRLTSELVYKNLPKGTFVLEKLKEKTPKTKGGNYKFRLHQSLTKKVGKEALKKAIYTVEALASISKTRTEFLRLIKEKYHPQQELLSSETDNRQNQETDFDKVLKTAINTPPLKLKDLKEKLKKEREEKKKL